MHKLVTILFTAKDLRTLSSPALGHPQCHFYMIQKRARGGISRPRLHTQSYPSGNTNVPLCAHTGHL